MSPRGLPLHFLLPLIIIGAMFLTSALAAGTVGDGEYGGYGSY